MFTLYKPEVGEEILPFNFFPSHFRSRGSNHTDIDVGRSDMIISQQQLKDQLDRLIFVCQINDIRFRSNV
jgi:hypothetical protein